MAQKPHRTHVHLNSSKIRSVHLVFRRFPGGGLGGGGSGSLLNDAQGKTYGQALMLLEVSIPEEIL